MKAILTLKLTPAFYTIANNYAANNNADVTIHEFFRDHFVYATFKTVNIQQNSVTGVYTLTVENSVKDRAPLTTLIDQFCLALYNNGVTVDGYTAPTFQDSVEATESVYNTEALLSDGKLLAWCKETDQNFSTDGDCVAYLLEARKCFAKLIYVLEHAE